MLRNKEFRQFSVLYAFMAAAGIIVGFVINTAAGALMMVAAVAFGTARMDWLLTSLLKISRLDAGIVEFQTALIEVDSLLSAALRPLLIPMDLHNIELQMDVPKGIYIYNTAGGTITAKNYVKGGAVFAVRFGTADKPVCKQ